MPVCCLLAFLPICSLSAELQVKSKSGENLKALAGETEMGSQSPWDDWGGARGRWRSSCQPRGGAGTCERQHLPQASTGTSSLRWGTGRRQGAARGPRWWWDRPHAAGDVRRHWVLAVLPVPKLCSLPGGPGNGELPAGHRFAGHRCGHGRGSRWTRKAVGRLLGYGRDVSIRPLDASGSGVTGLGMRGHTQQEETPQE